MKASSHRRRLRNLNLGEDIKYCLTPNTVNVVPVLQDGALVDARTLKVAKEDGTAPLSLRSFSACGLLGLFLSAGAWGFSVHRHIHGAAVDALPEPLHGWFETGTG